VPLPGGEALAAQATELICRAGRATPCDLLRAGTTVQFAPLGGLGNVVYSPGMLTLDAGLESLPPEDVGSVLAAAATYAALGSPPSPSCADIGRAETEQAQLWRWAYPDGRYPAGSPRTSRMRQIVAALGPDGAVQPRLDPARAAECPG
jgi:hypothetical protein